LNDLDEDETWREVGQLLGPAGEVQTVTTACHHCEDPACLSGCPVGAYEQDPVTGIVRHLDDQCFGCGYCLLKCPYDVPRYSATRGIVRKCDMCADRLRVGDAPACVQGCPNEAISIAIVPVGGASASALLPVGADALPDGGYTRPTTIYASREGRAPMRRADRGCLEPRPSHPPLVAMLVGSQVAVGLSVLTVVATARGATGALALAGLALAVALASLAASLMHLGRPWLAFRAFLGLRTSWLSREVVAFGAYVGATALAVLFAVRTPGSPLALASSAGAAALGLGTVLCSVLVYADTRRPLWALRRTGP
jgi:ferredoxin